MLIISHHVHPEQGGVLFLPLMGTSSIPHFLNLVEVEAFAREILPKSVFDYFRGGSEGETTLQANATSFSRLKLLPRILRNVSCVSMSTCILGKGKR